MEMFEIGIIVKPQGIRGELRVLPTTDAPERFQLLVGDNVYVRADGAAGSTDDMRCKPPKSYKLTQARQHKGLVIIKLEGVSDRNAAEELLRGVLVIPPEKALPLAQDEYYVRDLVGLTVESEAGERLGTITQIISTNANDVYVISPQEGKPFMIPAIKDVVLGVSMEDKKVTVRLMDGMRELLI